VNRLESHPLAIWAVTPDGVSLALKVREAFAGILHVPDRLMPCPAPCFSFSRLADSVRDRFPLFDAHIFIMSTGIVVRVIAPCIVSKTTDPAVVVMDEKGRHVISLLSGHIGGANRLAASIAEKLQAAAVITTATDIHQVPAIDVIATDHGLFIENPQAIKTISMAFLDHEPVCLYDPLHRLDRVSSLFEKTVPEDLFNRSSEQRPDDPPVVIVDDRRLDFPKKSLILRPQSLIAGIGCNRNTDAAEIRNFLIEQMEQCALSMNSLSAIATIDIKSDETGLLEAARQLDLPIQFFTREELAGIVIPTPSEIVNHHIGVPSVCEAAAILASNKGELIVPKRISPNVTLAIARIDFTSSV